MVAGAHSFGCQGAVVERQGKRLIGPVDLALPLSGITTVIGPNGAGKTTLLRVLHGLDRLTAGHIQPAPGHERQSFVFQSPIILHRSVSENLAYPLRVQGADRRAVEEKVAQWLSRTGLTDHAEDHAPTLSGGEKQKLALARALITEPKLLFLDEPCANLDGQSMALIEQILTVARAQGTTMILATHDLGQVRRLADHLVFIHRGKVLEQGAAQDLLSAPQSAELAAYLKGDIVA